MCHCRLLHSVLLACSFAAEMSACWLGRFYLLCMLSCCDVLCTVSRVVYVLLQVWDA